jgi:large subunit ribosomal protein L13
MRMKTYSIKKQEVVKKWYLIDAKDQVLGRVASRVAAILRGKHKATYTPHIDMGDNVIIINADKVKLTGTKPQKKMYYRHSGYPGGLKETSFLDMMRKDPTFAMRNAIKGMLPHNRLGRRQLLHVKIYAGENHPHEAQKPEKIEIS